MFAGFTVALHTLSFALLLRPIDLNMFLNHNSPCCLQVLTLSLISILESTKIPNIQRLNLFKDMPVWFQTTLNLLHLC